MERSLQVSTDTQSNQTPVEIKSYQKAPNQRQFMTVYHDVYQLICYLMDVHTQRIALDLLYSLRGRTKPVPISMEVIHERIKKDPRTIEKSITNLVELGFIVCTTPHRKGVPGQYMLDEDGFLEKHKGMSGCRGYKASKNTKVCRDAEVTYVEMQRQRYVEMQTPNINISSIIANTSTSSSSRSSGESKIDTPVHSEKIVVVDFKNEVLPKIKAILSKVGMVCDDRFAATIKTIIDLKPNKTIDYVYLEMAAEHALRKTKPRAWLISALREEYTLDPVSDLKNSEESNIVQNATERYRAIWEKVKADGDYTHLLNYGRTPITLDQCITYLRYEPELEHLYMDDRESFTPAVIVHALTWIYADALSAEEWRAIKDNGYIRTLQPMKLAPDTDERYEHDDGYREWNHQDITPFLSDEKPETYSDILTPGDIPY